MTVFRDSKWMTSNLVFLVLRARRVVYRWWVGTALPGLGIEHEKIGQRLLWHATCSFGC